MVAVVEMLITVLIIAALTLIFRIKWLHRYWQRKGVPYVKPHFIYGNLGNLFTREQHLGIMIKRRYDELKKINEKHGGLYSYSSAIYLPIDTNIIKCIMQKHFTHFSDRGFYYNEKYDPLSAHLFAISGPKWRKLRTNLTPTFTSGKMKMMFETLVECADNIFNAVQKYEGGDEGVDIKDILARYTIDVIGSCAFGLECNSFKNEDSEFRKHGKSIFKPYTKFESFRNVLAFNYPNLLKKAGVKVFPKEATTFFTNVVRDTIKYREQNSVKRKDMLQLLMNLKETNPEADVNTKALTFNEIAAQAFVFFVAGFETSSTTMAYCLYELSRNADIQEKVRNEINNVLKNHGGKVTYDAIMEMKYMGQVVDETLRKYPPLAFVTRRCVEDYKIPDTNVTIEKGVRVFIPIYALHHDPDFYPNPENFDPNRFSDESKSKIHQFSYIPFGEGPRMCIGTRFGLLQTKVGLTYLLRNYRISLNNKTITPLKIDRYSFILTAEGGIWLNIEKVSSFTF